MSTKSGQMESTHTASQTVKRQASMSLLDKLEYAADV